MDPYVFDTFRRLLEDVSAKQTGTNQRLNMLIEKGEEQMHHLERLTEAVNRIETKGAAIVALVEGLAQEIRDNQHDPAALNDLADRIDATSDGLLAAINANTPGDPIEPDPEPDPDPNDPGDGGDGDGDGGDGEEEDDGDGDEEEDGEGI